MVLLLYGGGVMDDLPLLDRRGVRRIFGWARVPNPTTFGRWLRRAAERMVPLLDALLWHMVRRRWAHAGGAPKGLTLVVDSTVVVRYGRKQAGAEVGYNPKKRGRPSHHPLVAFIRETGDCLGVRWRAGSAHTAEGATEWIGELVGRLRAGGVEDVTVRLDKGFFSRKMVRTLEGLGVSFLLKVPRHRWLSGHRGSWRFSARGEAVFPGEDLWTASGKLWGARLLTVQTTRPVESDGALAIDTYEVLSQAAAHAAAEPSPRVLADGPAQAASPLALPAAREADRARPQDLSSAPSRRTGPSAPSGRAANPRPRDAPLRSRPEPLGPAAPRGSLPRSSRPCLSHGRSPSVFGLCSVPEKPSRPRNPTVLPP